MNMLSFNKSLNNSLAIMRLLLLGLLVFCWFIELLCNRQHLNFDYHFRRRQQYIRLVFRLLAISQRQSGAPPGRGILIVANHISWIDILLIAESLPCRFVAKAEILHWPIFGRTLAPSKTIITQRTKNHDLVKVNEQITGALCMGDTVVVFPEGSTSDTLQTLPFRRATFQPAITTGKLITPLAISYLDEDGRRSAAISFTGSLTLLASLWTIARAGKTLALLNWLPPLASENNTRQFLAQQAEQKINAALLKENPLQTDEQREMAEYANTVF